MQIILQTIFWHITLKKALENMGLLTYSEMLALALKVLMYCFKKLMFFLNEIDRV